MKFTELELNKATKISALLLNVEEKRTKNNTLYLNMSLSDGETIISANLWDTAKENFPIERGNVVEVVIFVKMYNDTRSYSINSCELAEDGNPEKFVVSAPLPSEKMFDDIYNLSTSLGVYAPLVSNILLDNKEKLMIWGAAKIIHHNVRGGLLYHIWTMVRSACTILKVYHESVNRELLLSGIILHDIGKIKELSCDGFGGAEYTADGTLFGHPYIGAVMVQEYAIKYDVPEKEANMLQHMVLAHHGTIEHGAVKLPAIPEACILHHLDCIDACMYQFISARENMMEGEELSDKIFGLGTRVYK